MDLSGPAGAFSFATPIPNMSDPVISEPGVEPGDALRALWTPRRRNRFLKEMRCSANISRACDQAGLSRNDAFALRAEDAAFRTAWDEAEHGAFDDLEEEILRRARDGVDKPVYFGGKVCGTTRTYNDALALEILKLRRERLGTRREDTAASSDQGEDSSRHHTSPVDLIEERLKQFEAAHPENA